MDTTKHELKAKALELVKIFTPQKDSAAQNRCDATKLVLEQVLSTFVKATSAVMGSYGDHTGYSEWSETVFDGGLLDHYMASIIPNMPSYIGDFRQLGEFFDEVIAKYTSSPSNASLAAWYSYNGILALTIGSADGLCGNLFGVGKLLLPSCILQC